MHVLVRFVSVYSINGGRVKRDPPVTFWRDAFHASAWRLGRVFFSMNYRLPASHLSTLIPAFTA